MPARRAQTTSTGPRWSYRRAPTPGAATWTSCSRPRKPRSWRCSLADARSASEVAEGEPAAQDDDELARPRYVAIITDGNGRWAKARGLPTIAGHEAGADAVKARLRDA